MIPKKLLVDCDEFEKVALKHEELDSEIEKAYNILLKLLEQSNKNNMQKIKIIDEILVDLIPIQQANPNETKVEKELSEEIETLKINREKLSFEIYRYEYFINNPILRHQRNK